jgi:hypothetical protein
LEEGRPGMRAPSRAPRPHLRHHAVVHNLDAVAAQQANGGAAGGAKTGRARAAGRRLGAAHMDASHHRAGDRAADAFSHAPRGTRAHPICSTGLRGGGGALRFFPRRTGCELVVAAGGSATPGRMASDMMAFGMRGSVLGRHSPFVSFTVDDFRSLRRIRRSLTRRTAGAVLACRHRWRTQAVRVTVRLASGDGRHPWTWQRILRCMHTVAWHTVLATASRTAETLSAQTAVKRPEPIPGAAYQRRWPASV